MKHRMIWSFAFLLPLFYISMGHMMGAPLPGFLVGMENALAFAFTQLLLTLPIMYLNDKYYKVGFKTLSSACSARPVARQPPAHPPGGCRPPRRCGGVPPAAPC